MMNKTSTEYIQQIGEDLFEVKEKLTSEEYLKLLNHMKGLYESIEKSNQTKKDLYIKLQDLRKKYIKMSETFECFYRQVHRPDYDEINPETFTVVD